MYAEYEHDDQYEDEGGRCPIVRQAIGEEAETEERLTLRAHIQCQIYVSQ